MFPLQAVLGYDLAQTLFVGPNCLLVEGLSDIIYKMNKADLKRTTGISTASIAKLGKGENVTTDILVKICKVLNCELNDIMELSREDEIEPKSYLGQ